MLTPYCSPIRLRGRDAIVGYGAARRRKAPPAPAPTGTSTRPRSREGKTEIVIYADPDLARALRHLAVDEGSSLQALGLEALQALRTGRGQPPIA